MPRIAIILVLFLLTVSPSLARDVFVNNQTGDDLFDGQHKRPDTARNGPVRTIGRALRLVKKGDRILVANTGAPYYESIGLSTGSQSGFSLLPFEIVANGAVLDGTRAVPHDTWRAVEPNVFRFDTNKFGRQRLFLDNKPASFRDAPAGLSDNQTETSMSQAKLGEFLRSLRPLEWSSVGRFVYFRADSGRFPDQYHLRYAVLQTGVTLYHVEYVRITGLTVHGFRLDGINAHDTVRHTELVDVNARACGRSGVTVAGASRLTLRDCFLFDNAESQLRTEGFSVTRLENTEASPASAPAFSRQGGRLFVDGKLAPAQ